MSATRRSNAETLLAVQLEQAGIPFQSEFRFHPQRRWRADFRLGAMWLVEIDGGGFVAGRHTRGTGFENDAEKQSAAAILGYRVIRCTPRQVDNGSCLSWIRQALGVEIGDDTGPDRCLECGEVASNRVHRDTHLSSFHEFSVAA